MMGGQNDVDTKREPLSADANSIYLLSKTPHTINIEHFAFSF